MFLGLRTVIYHAPDLPKAKAWYSAAFGVGPGLSGPDWERMVDGVRVVHWVSESRSRAAVKSDTDTVQKPPRQPRRLLLMAATPRLMHATDVAVTAAIHPAVNSPNVSAVRNTYPSGTPSPTRMVSSRGV